MTIHIYDAAYALAERLATPVRRGLYRSPKTTARINAEPEAKWVKAYAPVN